MAEIGNTTVFSQTDGSNNSGTVPTWAEGQAPSQVNDSARALQGAVTREWNWRNVTLTSGGSADVHTLTYSVAPAAYYNGQIFGFIAGFTNTGATTLNVNSLGATNVKKMVSGTQTALAAGDVIAGNFYLVAYNSSGSAFILLTHAGAPPVTAGANIAFTGNNTHAGTETFNETVTISKEIVLTGVVSATISADQTDYAPTGHADARTFRLSPDAANWTINSLDGGVDGREIIIENTNSGGVNTLTLLHDDSATGTAAMRFWGPNGNNVVLRSLSNTMLRYDGTNSRWRIIANNAPAAQSHMEAGTSVWLTVTPSVQQHHPSACKMWVESLANSTTIELDYNVDSVADTATGSATYTITTDFSSVDWACQVSRAEDDLTLVYSATYNAKAAGTVVVNSVVEAGSGSDPSSSSGNATWSCCGFGDHA